MSNTPRLDAFYEYWLNHADGWQFVDRQVAIAKARDLFEEGFLILDTETTGLYNAEIVEIAIIDHLGNVLLDTLVKPTKPIPLEVIAIHGIDDQLVADSPTFLEIYDNLKSIISGKKVLIYNAEFDCQILRYTSSLNGCESISFNPICAMKLYAQYVNRWSDYWNGYQWFPLNGGHRAKADCQQVLKLLTEMKNTDFIGTDEISLKLFLAESLLIEKEITIGSVYGYEDNDDDEDNEDDDDDEDDDEF